MKNDDYLNALIHAMENKRILGQPSIALGYKKEELRHKWEYSCSSELTDRDMLKIHIDIALDQGDKEMFLKLVKQLEGVH